MDAVALQLRFGEGEESPLPPDLEAFSRPGSTERREPVAVLGRGSASSGPRVVFFRHASFGIPAIEIDPSNAALDFSSWNVRPTIFGYVAAVPTGRSANKRGRAAWIVAACLPLVLPASAAARGPAPIQRPDTATVIPDAPGDGDDQEVGDPVEAPEDAGDEGLVPSAGPPALPDDAQPEADPDAQPEADPEPSGTEGPPPPPNPFTGAALGAARDRATLDAAWEGVDGYDVDLRLKGGQKMSGQISAVQRDTFTMIEADTGVVLVLPKSGVATLRVKTPAPLPSDDGRVPLVGGAILTGLISPVFLSGVVLLGVCPSCVELHIPLLLVGGTGLGIGIPLIIRGTRRRQAYRDAVNERGLSAAVMPTRRGWTGGLRFRF